MSGCVEPQARIQFKGGNIFGGIGRQIRILTAANRGILIDADSSGGTVTDDIPVEIGAVNGNISVTVMAAGVNAALGAVRYDVEQNLTPEEQQRARANIGVGAGDDLNFAFTQNVASDLWMIQHNLGKYPSVSVADSAGTEVVGMCSILTRTNCPLRLLLHSPEKHISTDLKTEREETYNE